MVYLEGFADSMFNHEPFFARLCEAGYRIIAFDHPGQGGSDGSMNQVRVPALPALARKVFDQFARSEDGDPRCTMLGWSTGGLAAYSAAEQGLADAVVLIAPGLHVRPLPGDFGKVTLDTLASVRYEEDESNPHVDPIKPSSPLKVPFFAASILKTSLSSITWEIDPSVAGLAILSGDGDTYVFSGKVRETLGK